MKKSIRSKNSNGKKKPSTQTRDKTSVDTGRRNLLSNIRNGAIGLVAVGGGGAYLYNAYLNDVAERDLTKIGKGTPAIVQIHDPNCSLCAALQRETRSAVSNFKDNELEFLVANIMTAKGREFANHHNVPHVTLLLFDGKGKLNQVIQGVRQEEELVPIFSSLVSKG